MPGADVSTLAPAPSPKMARFVAPADKVTFAQGRRSFHDDVRARVKAWLDEHGGPAADPTMALRIAFWVLLPLAIYASVLFLDLGRPLALLLWCIGGFGLAGLGFNLGHDAIHGAVSSKRWVNRLLSLSFDVMGASSDTWAIAHNFQHHTYTNIKDADTDIEPGPFIRLYPRPDDVRWFHRFQFLYAWGLYSLAALNWVWVKDWVQMFLPDPRTGKRLPSAVMAKVVAGKVCHITLFLVVPLLVTDFAWWEIGIGYALAGMVAGFTLAVVFQMAHVVEDAEFPLPGEAGRVEDSWAEHQMRTTANFGGGNWLIHFIVGGLDHQIEHHLFPKVAHVHYPAIAPIVRQCAEDHGLPYLENVRFLDAVRSHGRLLWACGRREEAQRLIEKQQRIQDGRRVERRLAA